MKPTPSFSPILSKHKTPEIVMHLRDMARRRGPDAKMPTVRDLCREFQVSSATLNDALRELEEQNIVTRRQGSGVYVSPYIHQKTIALVLGENLLSSNVSPFYSILVRQCEKRVKSHGENFSLFMDLPGLDRESDLPVHSDLANAVRSGKIHGILLANRNSDRQEAWLRSQGRPLVSLGDSSYGERVDVDREATIRKGLSALIAQGCRRIGLISPYDTEEGRFPWDKDVRWFEDGLREHGFTLHPEWVKKRGADPADYRSGQEFGARAIRSLYAGGGEKPDGLLILDDMVARGVLDTADDLKIPLGTEIKVATHANKGSAVLKGDEDRLTLLEVDPSEIAQKMLELLERLMAGRSCPDSLQQVAPSVRMPALVAV